MSEADKMFDELGYKINKEEYMIINFDYPGEKEKYKNGKEKNYYKYGSDKRIVFYLDIKEISVYSPTLLDDFEYCAKTINMKELKAINMKVEELRMEQWLRDALAEEQGYIICSLAPETYTHCDENCKECEYERNFIEAMKVMKK